MHLRTSAIYVQCQYSKHILCDFYHGRIYSYTIMMRLLLLKTCFIAFSQSQSSLETQKYFKNVKGHGSLLTSEDVISNHSVHSKIECSLKCLQKSTCVGYNYRSKLNNYAINCQLGNKPPKEDGSGEWSFYQDLKTLTTGNVKANDISMKKLYHPDFDDATSCKELHILRPQFSNGYYKYKNLEAYCDLSNNGWTLIARFSNNDSKHWMANGDFWYDKVTPHENTGSPLKNADMISTAFWKVRGDEFKITRSDDPSHTALLQTTSNCLRGGTFRSKITSYGNYRNSAVWASDECRGNCPVSYGGQYQTTTGFEQHSCSSDIQNSNYIGFWCDWNGGDGAVMMIGGGGKDCARADHGIGITEENEAKFGGSLPHNDFGYDANSSPSSLKYSLNLWVR